MSKPPLTRRALVKILSGDYARVMRRLDLLQAVVYGAVWGLYPFQDPSGFWRLNWGLGALVCALFGITNIPGRAERAMRAWSENMIRQRRKV